MKRISALLLVLMLTLSFSGCKKQTQLEFSSFGLSDFGSQETVGSAEAEVPAEGEAPAEGSEPSDNVSGQQSQTPTKVESDTPSSVPAETEATVICAHDYRGIAVGVSCTTAGYMQYTCTKCGHSYNGEALPPGHDFSKYLCEGCGKIDPECDVFWGMNAFLSKYGTPNGKGNMNCYPNDSAELQISNSLDQKPFSISLEDTVNGGYVSAYISQETVSISYRKNLNRGYFHIEKSKFNLYNKIVFDEFSADPANPVDVDVFATECAEKLKVLFQRAESEILIPKTGLTFKNFGFNI